MRKQDVKVGAPVFWGDPNGGILSRYLRVAAVGNEFVALTELGEPSGTIVAVVPPRELTKVPVDWRDDIEKKLRPRFKLVIEVEYDLTGVHPTDLQAHVDRIQRGLDEAAPFLAGEGRLADGPVVVANYGSHVSVPITPAEYKGCGAPTHMSGTNGGTFPCGSMVDMFGDCRRRYCPRCQDAKGLDQFDKPLTKKEHVHGLHVQATKGGPSVPEAV